MHCVHLLQISLLHAGCLICCCSTKFLGTATYVTAKLGNVSWPHKTSFCHWYCPEQWLQFWFYCAFAFSVYGLFTCHKSKVSSVAPMVFLIPFVHLECRNVTCGVFIYSQSQKFEPIGIYYTDV